VAQAVATADWQASIEHIMCRPPDPQRRLEQLASDGDAAMGRIDIAGLEAAHRGRRAAARRHRIRPAAAPCSPAFLADAPPQGRHVRAPPGVSR
jgi:hypothetical protein